MKKIGIFFGKAIIYIYRLFLRPLFPTSCRFYPTCSEYTLQSIKKYGFFKGFFKGLQQFSQCHGFFK